MIFISKKTIDKMVDERLRLQADHIKGLRWWGCDEIVNAINGSHLLKKIVEKINEVQIKK